MRPADIDVFDNSGIIWAAHEKRRRRQTRPVIPTMKCSASRLLDRLPSSTYSVSSCRVLRRSRGRNGEIRRGGGRGWHVDRCSEAVSYTHLRAHETKAN